MLSQHIAEHDDLPRVVSGAVQFALLQQSQRFGDEVVRLSAEYTDQLRAATDEAICKIRHENEETVSGVVADNGRLDPNPPMDGARIAEGGEEVTDATVRARIRVDWRLAGGLSALLGVLIAACDGCGERDGGIGYGKKHSRTGPGASWRGS